MTVVDVVLRYLVTWTPRYLVADRTTHFALISPIPPHSHTPILPYRCYSVSALIPPAFERRDQKSPAYDDEEHGHKGHFYLEHLPGAHDHKQDAHHDPESV